MAPRKPIAARPQRAVIRSKAPKQANDDSTILANGTSRQYEVEQEYHTEESDASELDASEFDISDAAEVIEPSSGEESDSDEEGSAIGNTATDPPLLPIDLLQPLPSPAYSPSHLGTIPHAQMTRSEKRAERTSSRRAKQREWDRLREEVKAQGTHGAGSVALKKKALVSAARVKNGRVEKKTKPVLSGRQRMIEYRKRIVGGEKESGMKSKTTKTKPRR